MAADIKKTAREPTTGIYVMVNTIIESKNNCLNSNKEIRHRRMLMTNDNKETNKTSKNNSMTAGATALLSVLVVPVTLLAGLLISTKRKR